MCGIAGIVSGAPDASAGENVLASTQALAHRGPDGAGFWRLAGGVAGLCTRDELREPAEVVLGHRRLSIVDVEGGAQPMRNEDGSVWVVFNGEIYNHANLRLELEHLGHRYRTRSDTETLVHGWEEWGEELFGRLNGIFAFAIADVRRREVVLVRDPMGIKPLADVPVASLLSGGVDSSLVTQTMAEHLPYAPQAFGIGMRSEGGANEALAAERAAAELCVPYNATVLEDEDYVAEWPSVLGQLGEPIANSSALLVRTICESVGRSHKVALCGQGADEALGGHPRHMTERLYRLGRLWPSLSRAVSRRGFGRESAARLDRALSALDRTGRYVELFSVLPGQEVDELVRGADASASELARAAVERWVPEESGDPVNDLLRVDARLSLADDLLIVGDHCAMRSSVELRVPFLDLAMIELVERMPSRHKVSPLGERKWLYRQAAARHLPPELARRLCPPTKRFERKRGFSDPLTDWFDTKRGLLAEHERWAHPLLELPELSPQRVEAALGTVGVGGLARRRSLLYTLAHWLETNRRLSPAPA